MNQSEKRWAKRVLVCGLLVLGLVHLAVILIQRNNVTDTAATGFKVDVEFQKSGESIT